ncbi:MULTISPECIES: hypothetical protein [unclassified Methylobacterium]|jgi:hypothetical protein|uniref:hypothetical protein n=1 Tax=unclassified Methylobacterium TaxID=2615210 RepID=UPI0005BE12DA|nr:MULTISPECIES: hypothetical protein [unclassified Methylobacterium]SFU96525.1 hypothetical protein SAMN02799643_03498 [Methylobacterium sp. UNCCL125]
MPVWPYATLDALCDQVGLSRVERLPAGRTGAVDPPEGTAFWAGTYAGLLFWPVAESGLAEAARTGQAWLDDVLKADEGGQAPIDGYLVLAQASAPERELVRALELSTQVCRKHVIWPDDCEMGWRGLAAVGVLGLPREAARVRRQARPALDAEAEALWQRIAEHGHGAVVAEDRSKVEP